MGGVRSAVSVGQHGELYLASVLLSADGTASND